MNNSLQFVRENTTGMSSNEEVEETYFHDYDFEEIESWLNSSDTVDIKKEKTLTLSLADEHQLQKARRSNRIDKKSKAHRYNRAKCVTAKKAKKEARSQLEYINYELDELMDKKLNIENEIFAALNGITKTTVAVLDMLKKEFEEILKQEKAYKAAKHAIEHPVFKNFSNKARSQKEDYVLSKHYAEE